jgi:uncharacterized protein (TIGR02646 family)
VKFIAKGRKPAALAQFERANAATPHLLTYAALSGEVKRALVDRLLAEQGRLCAYTMQRIGGSGPTDYHVEHFRPQSSNPALQIDYFNLLLCAPGADKPDCEWGAVCKKNIEPDDDNFVSPLRANCETRLTYLPDGNVCATDNSDLAASSTIRTLNLNHRELVAERSRVLRAFGLSREPRKRKPLSAREAERLSRQICLPSRNGDFEPFCVAIQQVANWITRKAEQRSARLRTAR